MLPGADPDALDLLVESILKSMDARLENLAYERTGLLEWFQTVSRGGRVDLLYAAVKMLGAMAQGSGDREVRARTTLEALMLLPDVTLTPFFGDYLLPGAATDLTAFNLLTQVTEDELRQIARHVPRERLVALTTELLEYPWEEGKRQRLLEAITLTLERDADPGASPAGPSLLSHSDPLLLELRQEIMDACRPEVLLASRAPLRVRADTFLRQAHDTIHMTGADASTALGGFTVRAEAAYFDDRPYLRLASDLLREARLPLRRIGRQLLRRGRAPVPLGALFPSLDSVEWGVGADYLVHGWQPLVQLNQIVLLEPAPRLLIADPETRLSGTLRKKLLAERLELEVRGTYAIERAAWFIFPRASYLVRDDLRLRLGYLAIGGPRASILGQFRENDEVVLQARYSF